MATKKRFEIIEHTADIGLIAYGDDLAGAFASAGLGMFSIVTDLHKIKNTSSITVTLSESGYEDLLFEWLNRLIYHFDVEGWIFKEFLPLEFTPYRLKFVCFGEKLNPARHRVKTGIKSATYHLLEVDESNSRVKVIFDI